MASRCRSPNIHSLAKCIEVSCCPAASRLLRRHPLQWLEIDAGLKIEPYLFSARALKWLEIACFLCPGQGRRPLQRAQELPSSPLCTGATKTPRWSCWLDGIRCPDGSRWPGCMSGRRWTLLHRRRCRQVCLFSTPLLPATPCAMDEATVLWCSTEASTRRWPIQECSLRTWCQTASGPLFMVWQSRCHIYDYESRFHARTKHIEVMNFTKIRWKSTGSVRFEIRNWLFLN
jgi:hypothetical protein